MMRRYPPFKMLSTQLALRNELDCTSTLPLELLLTGRLLPAASCSRCSAVTATLAFEPRLRGLLPLNELSFALLAVKVSLLSARLLALDLSLLLLLLLELLLLLLLVLLLVLLMLLLPPALRLCLIFRNDEEGPVDIELVSVAI